MKYVHVLYLPFFQITAYHYDVVIEPDKPRFLLRSVICEFYRQKFPNRAPIYDGNKNCYSNGPLTKDKKPISGEVLNCFFFLFLNEV